MKLRCLLPLALAGAWASLPIAQAAEPLRLEHAVARALAADPSLAAEAARLRAAQARALREALPPPYVVAADFENVAGTGALSGVDGAETTLRLGRVLELGGKRAARVALGDAETARQSHAVSTARLASASRVASRFIEVAADQERLRFAQERVAQAQQTRRAVAGWVAAARNPESDLAAADIALAEAELQREHAEHELAAARGTLAASWGSDVADFESVAGELDAIPAVDGFEQLAARLPASAAQRTLALEAESAAARRRIAEAGAKPDLNFNLGVRRLESVDDEALVFSMSMPLGSRGRAAHAIAEADAELAAVHARSEAGRFEARQLLFERYQELLHARSELEALRERMLPAAERAFAFSRRAFEAGRFSFVALAQAQKTLFDLRARRVEAAASYHALLVEIDRLTAATTDSQP